MQKVADRMDRPYQFLSDANLEVTDLYGIRRDEELPPTRPSYCSMTKA